MRKQNIDHHSDGVVNKNIENCWQTSTKFAGYNLDRSSEFISTCFNFIKFELNIFNNLKMNIQKHKNVWFLFILDSLSHLNCFVYKVVSYIFMHMIFMPIEIGKITIR